MEVGMIRKYFFLDTETTGLNPIIHDIIQMGIIVEIDGVLKEEVEIRCQPFNYDSIVPIALETNGITLEEIRTYDTPKVAFEKLVSLLRKYVNPVDREDRFIIVGQNAKFDANMLQSFFAKNRYAKGFESFFDYKTIDSITLNFILQRHGLLPKSNLKLQTMVATYGIKTAKSHDAVEDIRATRQIIKIIESVFIKDINEIDLSLLESGTPLYNHLSSLKEAYGKEKKR